MIEHDGIFLPIRWHLKAFSYHPTWLPSRNSSWNNNETRNAINRLRVVPTLFHCSKTPNPF
jgi:hypothetical protein